jgi:Putative Actinobacterial Holin-X, holin superfamily III
VTETSAGAPRRTSTGSPDTPGEALAAVVDHVGALVRAELRLAAIGAKAFIARAGVGLALLWLALLLLQVFALLLALSPILFASHPWPGVVWTLGISFGLALGVSLLAVRMLRRLKDAGNDANHRETGRYE